MSNTHRTWPVWALAAACIGGMATLAIAQDPPKQEEKKRGEFPAEWFYGSPEQRAKHEALMGKEAPELVLSEWMNVDPEVMNVEDGFDLKKDAKGKVVLIDYWATW